MVGGTRGVTKSALYPAETAQDAGTQLLSPNLISGGGVPEQRAADVPAAGVYWHFEIVAAKGPGGSCRKEENRRIQFRALGFLGSPHVEAYS